MRMVEKLQALCKEKSISFHALEKELGFGKGTIYRWDDKMPSVDKVAKVADYFGVSVDYLLGRTDDPNIHVVENPQKLEHLGVTEVRTTSTEPFTPEQVEAIKREIEKHLGGK